MAPWPKVELMRSETTGHKEALAAFMEDYRLLVEKHKIALSGCSCCSTYYIFLDSPENDVEWATRDIYCNCKECKP